MLKYLAEKNGSVVIDKIVRHHIENTSSKKALRSDFPEGFYDQVDNFHEMEFFRSPNGMNTLDLLKKLTDKDQFSLINKVTIEKRKLENPNVIIELKSSIELIKPL